MKDKDTEPAQAGYAARPCCATLARRPYTFTAKRYTFPYTRTRMELDREKLDVYRVALDFAAWAYTVCRYGYVNENGYEGQSGQEGPDDPQ